MTSLSLKTLPTARIKVGPCHVSSLKNRRRYPLPPVLATRKCSPNIAEHLDSTRYALIRVSTKGRTVHEAAKTAFEAMTLLRALWNLLAGYGSWSIFSSSQKKPLGLIHQGPVHTLHHASGESVDDIYWHEPAFTGDHKLFQDGGKWKELESHRRWAMRKLAGLPYSDALVDLLSRYASALESTNLEVAFLHLWGVLERVTNTVGARYDDTIRRAIWPFQDRQLAKEFLMAVRCRRNQYVHAARSGDDSDQIAYMAKSIVDPHLRRLIRNDFGVSSLEEYSQCLTLPTSIEALEKQHRQLGRALAMRKKWEVGRAGN